jgi:hypothetical protein
MTDRDEGIDPDDVARAFQGFAPASDRGQDSAELEVEEPMIGIARQEAPAIRLLGRPVPVDGVDQSERGAGVGIVGIERQGTPPRRSAPVRQACDLAIGGRGNDVVIAEREGAPGNRKIRVYFGCLAEKGDGLPALLAKALALRLLPSAIED